MRLHKVARIEYSKEEQQPVGTSGTITTWTTTARKIIPTELPSENIKALDVSGEDNAEQIAELYAEYSQYLKTHMKAAFSFEDWLSHTQDIDFTPKWRIFKRTQTREV